MCTRYISPEDREIEAQWHIGARNAERWVRDVRPLYKAPFLRLARDGFGSELVTGQWGLIPIDSETAVPRKKDGSKLSTFNARSEEIHWKWSFRDVWAMGQRCIIPAQSFFEPNWETGRHIPWQFRRANGKLWGLAGIWNTWIDRATGEVHESFSMLTINADAHPLMSRMHKPDPKRPPNKQDKRSVVVLEEKDYDLWLRGSVEEAKALIQPSPVEIFEAGPAVGTEQLVET